MLRELFDQVQIPHGRALLVHARLRRMQQLTGLSYKKLADTILQCLLDCKPTLLLVPAFTIYSYMAVRIFHLEYARSEVGRFSEEMRQRGFSRTPDPMYSMLDIIGTLPSDLDYLQTFGPGTLFEYLGKLDTVVVNVDMEGFYATPVHGVELVHQVPYRFTKDFEGHMQTDQNSWKKITYSTYVRPVRRDGTGSYPPYNQQRRIDYLRQQGILKEAVNSAGHLAWAPLDGFCSAISKALHKDKCFLVDQV